MYGPRALISILAVLLVFAGATYVLNGSVATTAWQTIICAIILQVGYFIGVLLLVRKERQKRSGNLSDSLASLRDKDERLKDELHGRQPSKFHIGDR